MNRQAQIATSITVDGVEQDVEARAYVAIEPPDGHYGRAYAKVDEDDIGVLVGGEWRDADALSLAPGDHDRLVEQLRVQALEDRRDAQQLRAEHYAARAER